MIHFFVNFFVTTFFFGFSPIVFLGGASFGTDAVLFSFGTDAVLFSFEADAVLFSFEADAVLFSF